MLDFLALEPGAFYIMDHCYLDFERLYLQGNRMKFKRGRGVERDSSRKLLR